MDAMLFFNIKYHEIQYFGKSVRFAVTRNNRISVVIVDLTSELTFWCFRLRYSMFRWVGIRLPRKRLFLTSGQSQYVPPRTSGPPTRNHGAITQEIREVLGRTNNILFT
jgi:hypothetical protein